MRLLVIDSRRISLRVGEHWLKAGECEAVVLAGAGSSDRDDARAAQRVAHVLPEIYFVGDFIKNPLVEAVSLELHSQQPFDAIVGVTEFDLIRAARLRKKFGLHGQSLESALAFRDKVDMKRRAAGASIAVAPYAVLSSPIDLQDFVEAHDLPVVVKPRSGSGGNGTTIISTSEELGEAIVRDGESLFDFQGARPSIVEAFVRGDFYHVDGLIVNDAIEFVWPARYLGYGLSFQVGQSHGSCLLASGDQLTRRLRMFALQVLEVLPPARTMAFHCEVFHTPDDDLVLCEIASRPAGGCIHRMIRHAFGIDLTRAVIRSAAALSFERPALSRDEHGLIPGNCVGWIGVPPRFDTKLSTMPQLGSDALVDAAINVAVGQPLSAATWCCDHVAEFVVSAKTVPAAEEHLVSLGRQFESHLVPVEANDLEARKRASATRENALCCR